MNPSETESPNSQGNCQSRLKGSIITLQLSNEKHVPKWIEAESPFKWQASRFKGVNSEEVIKQAKEKAEYEYNSFDKFSRILTLIYEYMNNGDTDEARDALLTLEYLLSEEDVSDYPELKLAMSHVFYATQAHYQAALGSPKEALEVSEKVVPMSELPMDAQAGVYALRAKFFSLYRKRGFQQAVESARRARELNPDEHKWMFLLAESLRREKKYAYSASNELPKEELQLLEMALEKDRNPQYLVHLALRCITCVNQAWVNHKNNKGFFTSHLYDVVKKMEEEAVNMIKEALRREPNDEIINRRCAFGMMKSRKETRKEHKELIRKSLEKALALAPDSTMTLHYLGKYYNQLGNDQTKALEYIRKSVEVGSNNYPAHCELIRLQFDMHKSRYDPTKDFEKMLREQTEVDPHYRHEALSNIGSYYLLVKQDLQKSIKYLEKIIDENGDPNTFMKYPIFMSHVEEVDLLGILLYKVITTTDEITNKEELIQKLERFSPKPYKNYLEIQNMIESLEKKVKPLRSKTPENWRSERKMSEISSESMSSLQSERNSQNQCNSNWRLRDDSDKSSEQSYSNWRVKDDSQTEKLSWRSNSSRNSPTRQRQGSWGYREGTTRMQRRPDETLFDQSTWRERKQ